jgi:hypothetical protein
MDNINYIKFNIKLIQKELNKLNKNGIDKTKNELIILKIFSEFYDKYPFIVKKLCKGDDISMLYKMLDNIDDINKGNKKIDDVESALGKELAEKYLSNIT